VIESLELVGFKRFGRNTLEFRNLTVLTGVNGTGKSTAIQALLLIRQIAEKPSATVVQLNGAYGLALGEAADVLHPSARAVEFTLVDGGRSFRYAFGEPDGRSLHLLVTAGQGPEQPQTLSGRGMAFTYLNAERLGPRDQLTVTSEDAADIGIGVHGEYIAQILAARETDGVRESLRHPRTAEREGVITLRTQVELWAEEIIRKIRITAAWPAGLSASTIRFQDPDLLTEPIRPANLGFGFSYALPVILAGLLVPSGGLLVVENPEAHLHPAGQSRLGRFLARVAAAGAQVIVETHSDHVINGIRLAVVEDGLLPPEDVLFQFFGTSPGGQPTSIEVKPSGALASWPPGFFDQMERDLGELSRAKRRRFGGGPSRP
jgi:predicted ATPase